jgi:hypothetical protein
VNCTPSELSTYLQALAEGYLAISSLVTDVSVPSKLNHIASKSYQRGRKTVSFRGSRFLMTFGALTEPLGVALLTWYREGFRAKTSVAPERERASRGSGPACGKKWRGSLARYDPDTCLWRTAQFSLLGGLELFSETFPRWGTMRSGELWERTTPVLRISGNAFGYWPTPRAQEPGRTTEGYGRDLAELVEGKDQRKANTPSGNWPTPTCSDAFTDKLQSSQQKEGSMHSVNLSQAVRMFPTPTATNTKAVHMRGADNGKEREPRVVQEGGGQLNPDWVEWLMGWPLGWTDLKPSGTDKFQAWCALHGIPFTPASPNVEATTKTEQA